MLSGTVELDFPFIFRFCKPINIGSVKRAAVHPHPAVGSDPFSAVTDVGMSSGDRHGDVAGIFESDAILGASIPDGVFRREFADAFDLRGTVVVEVESPMRDIAVMADPIQQLATAGVV